MDADKVDLQAPEVRAYLEHAYRTALDRGVRFLAVSTRERSYYREHLLDAFPRVPFGDRLRLEHFARSDHVFSAQADSERLVDVVVDWACSTFASGGQKAAGAPRGAALG
jgi:hypothetical protein